jgi:hypothetical protein
VLAVLAFGAIALAAVACGSPDPERREFVFTPVPYTPTTPSPEYPSGHGRVCTEKGDQYVADQILMTVHESAEDDVRDALESYGFVVLERGLRNNHTGNIALLVEVPLGSAVAAAALMAEHNDVLFVNEHGIARVPEAPNPCEPPSG